MSDEQQTTEPLPVQPVSNLHAALMGGGLTHDQADKVVRAIEDYVAVAIGDHWVKDHAPKKKAKKSKAKKPKKRKR